MSSTNNTPKYFTPNQYPLVPRRGSITPSVRPSTSGGETIEPKSDFLRDALREKKGLPPRSQSTTPRKVKSNRPPISQLAHDELFLPSSDDDTTVPVRRQLFRPQRTRRASEITPAKSSPHTQVRNLGVKEADAHMDKLLKENWDLKHRITLHDQAYSKLRTELDAALEELDKFATVRHRNEQLQDAIEAVSRHAAMQEEENKALKINNAELTVLNDDLVRELDAKDEGIQQRQLAIEEAAGIIQQLEDANESLKKQQQQPHSPRPDSDYFSGDTETTPSMKMSLRPTTAGTCGTDYTNPPDSDYFSADSPSLTPTTPKRTPSIVQTKDKAIQMDRAKAMGAAFNREVGLRTQASKDSLFSSFLTAPIPEANQRRRRTPNLGPPPAPRGSIREELQRAGTPPWTSARGLRAIYEDGDLHRRIDAAEDLRRSSGYTPSVTVGSLSRVPSTDDLYHLSGTNSAVGGANPSLPTLASLATTISDSSSCLASPKSTSSSKARAIPNQVNYSAWPRKLPDWPPSAGLRNRDILFHGTGMDEMFPDSPPQQRPSSSRGSESFSSVHLLRSNASPKERHVRSSSAAPTANAVAPPPPPPAVLDMTPQAQPSGLGKMFAGWHRKGSASVSGVRRPGGLEGSRTLPSH